MKIEMAKQVGELAPTTYELPAGVMYLANYDGETLTLTQ